jgi:hypothetical protein
MGQGQKWKNRIEEEVKVKVDWSMEKKLGLGPIAKHTQGPKASLLWTLISGPMFSPIRFGPPISIQSPIRIGLPEESKAQLKWAPATSKDGSDYDPPSPVTQLSLPPVPARHYSFLWIHNS